MMEALTQQDAVNAIEKELASMPQIALPLKHHFTPGLYVREIFMPKGAAVVSATHKTTHVFVIAKGSARVYEPGGGIQHLQAPYTGCTKPGTRRVISITEDCVWMTFHPNPENITDLDKLESLLIEPRPQNEIRDSMSAVGICELPKELGQ